MDLIRSLRGLAGENPISRQRPRDLISGRVPVIWMASFRILDLLPEGDGCIR